jgi:hypothetical protein
MAIVLFIHNVLRSARYRSSRERARQRKPQRDRSSPRPYGPDWLTLRKDDVLPRAQRLVVTRARVDYHQYTPITRRE